MNTIVAAIVSVVLSIVAQFLLKSGMSGDALKADGAVRVSLHSALELLANAKILAGFALYALGACTWLLVLARWDVSKAYPLSGLGFALTVLLGFALGEQITLLRASGVAMICAGVLVVGAS